MRILIKTGDRAGGNDGGDGVFIDELGRFAGRVEQDREGVETAHHSAKLNSANEVDRNADILFANLV